MGIVFVLWSWLAFAFPMQHAVVQEVSEQTTVKTEKKSGIASFYHNRFEGRKTATGEVFDNDLYTAASNHFPLGTYVKVTNVRNGKVVYVKINDRMGHRGRIIDLASIAAKDLKFVGRGTTKVEIEVVPAHEGKRQILAQNTDKQQDPEFNQM
jgi:rare lipoprotein A